MCIAALAITANPSLTPLLRLAATAFALASAFGVLRFSGVYPELFWHTTFSLVTAVAGFPALAFALAYPQSNWIRTWRRAAVTALAFAVVGVTVVIGFELRIYSDACALLATLIAITTMLRERAVPGAIGAVTMLVGLACFALKIPVAALLQPADILHLTLAAGLTLIARAASQRGVTDIIQVG